MSTTKLETGYTGTPWQQKRPNIFNKHGVGAQGDGKIVIARPPLEPMTKEEAVIFAAWLVSVSHGGDINFEEAIQEIYRS